MKAETPGTTPVQGDRILNSTFVSNRDKATWLALGAVAGPILFTQTWIILGFVSPGFRLWDIQVAPYSPVSHPISGLGLGPTGLCMNTAFVVSGILIILGSAGIFKSIPELSARERTTGIFLLAHTGLGMLLSGIFTLEMIVPHTAGYVMGTGTPVLTFLVCGLWLRRIPAWRGLAGWLLLGSPLALVLLLASMLSFDPVAAGAGQGITGLVQRVQISVVLGLIAVMGWKAFRRSSFSATAYL